MRVRVVAVVSLVLIALSSWGGPTAMAQGSRSCAAFDAWEWAQQVFEADPQSFDALDPDGNGLASEDLPRGGFAPAFWTDTIPADVEAAQLVRIIDGDTFEVTLDGESSSVRIYRADTPETQTEQHCGGVEATAFADWALSFNDHGATVYLERDATTVDRYGRELAYVWFDVAGVPYLLNHILIANGWAADVDYGDHPYDQQFQEGAAFAQRHQLGAWAQCGGFGMPLAVEPVAQGPAPDAAVQDPPAEQPPVEEPAPDEPEAPAPESPADTGCDPNYSPCVPLVSYDLNCPDIGFSVAIIGGDPHGFDGNDNDGLGCESY